MVYFFGDYNLCFFRFYRNSEGTVQLPNRKKVERLWNDLKIWQNVINEEAEHFTGDILINSQDELKSLTSLVQKWTEVSLQLFTRHQVTAEGEDEKKTELRKESEMMRQINAEIEVYLNRCDVRITGENGTKRSSENFKLPNTVVVCTSPQLHYWLFIIRCSHWICSTDHPI